MDLNPSFTFETMVVGPSNELAVRAARRVAERPGGAHNPLFVSGQPGQGKTHLLMALAQAARRQHRALHVRYMTILEFSEAFDTALAAGQDDRFCRRLAEVNVLLVDDVHLVENRADVQEALRFLHDHLWMAGHQLVVSADRPPDALVDLDKRLVSGLANGLIVHLGPPDSQMRLNILEQCAETLGEPVDGEALVQIARQPVRNVRDMLSDLARVVALGTGGTATRPRAKAESVPETSRKVPRPPRDDRPVGHEQFESFVAAVRKRVTLIARAWDVQTPRADATSLRRGVQDHEKMIRTWPHAHERLIEELR